MHRQFVIFLTSLLILAFLSNTSPAQPGMSWFDHFDAGANECYFDIYAVHDSSYIAVGSSGAGNECSGQWLITRVGQGGDLIWSRTYGNPTRAVAKSVIEADNGDFVVVGSNRFMGNVDVMRIDAEGNQIWRNIYLRGEARAIIELKSGDFLVCGVSQREGFLLMLNGEGRELWSRTYPISLMENPFGNFRSMRETDNQVIVAGDGYRWARAFPQEVDLNRIWLVKVDIAQQGAVIWDSQIEYGRTATCNTIVSCEGGFKLSGMSNVRGEFKAFAMKVNEEGEQLWTHLYEHPDETEYGWAMAQDHEGNIAIAGRARNAGSNYARPMMILANSEGEEQGASYYNFADMEGFQQGYPEFQAVVVGLDNAVVAAGNVFTTQQGYNGLIAKWEPNNDSPYLVSWTPEDSLLTVLTGDSVEFAVHVGHQWGRAINFNWWVDEGDTLTTDTTVTITFNEAGEHIVSCAATDGRNTIIKTWRVNTVDFYLASYTPEALELSSGRNEPIDFNLNVLGIQDVEIEYSWILSGRGGEIDLDGWSSLTYDFPQAGLYFLEARIFNDDTSYEIVWDLEVVSSIWTWEPEALDWSIPVDSTMEFVLYPYNPDSDSLEFLWMLDGELISTSEDTDLRFREIGQSQLLGILIDGCETDTVSWTIETFLPNGVNSRSWASLPDRICLNPAAPNPFNSTTRLSYQIPQAGHVRFGVFDASGREVAQLADGWKGAGRHEYAFNAADLTTGVYFARLETGPVNLIKKFTLIK